MRKSIEPISKKISVLMVTGVYFPEINGAVLQCMKIISLLRDNLQFIVLSATKNKNLLKNRSVEGIDVYRFSVSNNRLLYFPQLFRIVFFFIGNREKFDIVHLHGFSSKSAFIIVLSKIFRKKIIIKLTSFGHDDPESVKRKGKILFSLYQFADSYIGVSPIFDTLTPLIFPSVLLEEIHLQLALKIAIMNKQLMLFTFD